MKQLTRKDEQCYDGNFSGGQSIAQNDRHVVTLWQRCLSV